MYSYRIILAALFFMFSAETAWAARCNNIIQDKLKTFEAGKIPLRTIYIRIDPSTAPANGSLQHPYPSLYQAQQAGILPGDELVIQGDVYNTWEGTTEMLLQGTAEHPISIRGDTGARLFGSIDGWLHALKLAGGSQYVYIHDLEIRDGGGHALHMNYVHDVVLERVKVINAREAAFKLSQSRNVFVRDSEFAGAGAIPGGDPNAMEVVDYVTVENFYIVRSKIHDGKHTLLMLKGPAINGFIGWNDLYDQHDTEEPALSLGAYTGFPIIPLTATYEGHNLTAFGNNIQNVGTPFAFKGCQNCAALHNSMKGTGPQLVRYLAGNAGGQTGLTYSETNNSVFKGNIVSGGDINSAMLQCQDGFLGTGNVVERNIFYNPSGVHNWWCTSIPSWSVRNVFGYDPQLSADGHVMTPRLGALPGPTDYNNVPFKDLFLADKAGACYGGPPPHNVGPYITTN